MSENIKLADRITEEISKFMASSFNSEELASMPCPDDSVSMPSSGTWISKEYTAERSAIKGSKFSIRINCEESEKKYPNNKYSSKTIKILREADIEVNLKTKRMDAYLPIYGKKAINLREGIKTICEKKGCDMRFSYYPRSQ